MTRRQQKISLFFLLILSLSGLLTVSVLVDRSVVIGDENFELAIREKLNYYSKPLYRSQFLGFVELDLSNRSINNIDGIEYFRNLEILHLQQNKISDVSPLETLTNLRILDLGYNRIINLDDANFNKLDNLQLKELRLDHNVVNSIEYGTIRLSDISLLSQQTSLRVLSLEDNHIDNLSPLGELRLLEELNLKENRLESLNGIEPLKNLRVLNLRENHLIDITSIQNLQELRYLNLHSNEGLKALSALGNLVKLETLIMRHVPVRDQINVIAGMTQLRRLNIRNCSVSDFSVLIELMASGALQDQPEKNKFAYLDILENAIPNDPYHLRGFRPYWDNIQVKYPFELNDSILPPPDFSVSDGFYEEPFYLELFTHLEDVSIHYTLDGSRPSLASSQYHFPLLIGEENTDRDGNLAGTVVRARLFQKDGYDASPTVTLTYFVGFNSADLFSLPVVSLVTDPDNFFDPDFGIYHRDNYLERGKKWERPIHLTLYDIDEEFSQDALVRIHGGISRGAGQKPLRFYAENNYASNEHFDYAFFPGYYATGSLEPLDRFSTIIFRNSGNDISETFFRDALIHSLMSHTSQDIQAYRPVNVFINGWYWGIYNIRERLDEYYIENHYGIDSDQVTIYTVDSSEDFYAQSTDDNEFLQLIDLVKNNDINDEEFFEFLLTQIDIDNFIDNQIIYIYSANGDWLWNNVRFWRKSVDEIIPDAPYWHDGRWRWMVFDMDVGFHEVDLNLLRLAISDHNGAVLMNALVNHPEFLNKFINRYADHLNTTFLPSRVIDLIDSIATNLEPDMPYHIARWNTMENSIEQWHENVNSLRRFAMLRPYFARQHIIEEFNLSGTSEITIKTSPDYGYIRLNTIDILDSTPGVYDPSSWTGIYFVDVPITITAIPYPGYYFSHWEGLYEDLSYDESIIFLPNEHMTITAIFAKDPEN